MGQVNPGVSASSGTDNQAVSLLAGEVIAQDDIVQIARSGRLYRAKPALGALVNKVTVGLSSFVNKTIATSASSWGGYDIDFAQWGVTLGNGNFAVVEPINETLDLYVRVYDIYSNLLSSYPIGTTLNGANKWLRVRIVDTNNFAVIFTTAYNTAPNLWTFNNGGARTGAATLAKPTTAPDWYLLNGNISSDVLFTPDGYLVLAFCHTSNLLNIATYTAAGAAVGWSNTPFGYSAPRNVRIEKIPGQTKVWISSYSSSPIYVMYQFNYATTGASAPVQMWTIGGYPNIKDTGNGYAMLANGSVAVVVYVSPDIMMYVINASGVLVASYTLRLGLNAAQLGMVAGLYDGGAFAVYGSSSYGWSTARLSADGLTLYQGEIFSSSSFLTGYSGSSYEAIGVRTTEDRIVVAAIDFDGGSNYNIRTKDFDIGYPIYGLAGTTTILIAADTNLKFVGAFLTSGSMVYISAFYGVSSSLTQYAKWLWSRSASLFGVALTGGAKGALVSVATKGTFSNMPADQEFIGGINSDQRTALPPGPRMAWIGRAALLFGLG
ncbi:hypothetical protein [uncultured Methylobacterium sp.]|uniref:hypothetical protein n=1 Tax=uncultured Methylobacterium sp. TaxID=157278 RepID=UPI0035C973B6